MSAVRRRTVKCGPDWELVAVKSGGLIPASKLGVGQPFNFRFETVGMPVWTKIEGYRESGKMYCLDEAGKFCEFSEQQVIPLSFELRRIAGEKKAKGLSGVPVAAVPEQDDTTRRKRRRL